MAAWLLVSDVQTALYVFGPSPSRSHNNVGSPPITADFGPKLPSAKLAF